MSIPYHINLTDEEERALDAIWGVDTSEPAQEERPEQPPAATGYTRRVHKQPRTRKGTTRREHHP